MIQVEVTQEDIDKGVRGSSGWCPIALAVNRVLPEHYVTVVDGFRAHCFLNRSHDTPKIVFNLPSEATYFISDFDARRPVQPFTFSLEEST